MITSATPGIGISAATGSETLTVGAGGMTFLPLGSGGGPRIYVDMPVVVGAAQTWQSLPNGEGHVYPHFTRYISVNANLNIDMRKGKDIASAYEPITVANGAKLTVSGNVPALILQNNARVTGTLEVANGSGICLASTNSSPVHFSNLLSSFVNNCYFYLGGYEGFFPDHVSKILFGEGDVLTTTATSTDRSASCLRIYDANVIVDGGDVRTRWFRLHNGRWTNRSGDARFDYQNIIGCGMIDGRRAVKEVVFDMQGGTYTFRRIAVGMGNRDDHPAQFYVSGGTAASDLLNPSANVQDSARWYSGLDIAVRWLNGETSNSGDNDAFVSDYAAGDVLVSGNGTLSVPRISFGGNKELAPSTACVTNGAGRLRMTGGEIRMGTIGFLLGDRWGQSGDSWYDVTFSGGKLSTLYSGARQDLKVRLSKADGGVAYDIGSGHTYTVGQPMFGSGGLVKTGAGTMVLESGNDYTGRTEIAQGRLLVRSSAAASGTAYTAAGVFCPNATMRLVADDLAGANGASVTSWQATSDSTPRTTFSQSTAANVLAGSTAPVVTTSGFNGHKAVSFDGVSSALAAGGADAPWVSSGNGSTAGFTVAMVVRFDGRGEGTAEWGWHSARKFFGPTRSGYGDAYIWNMSLTGAGQLEGGSIWARGSNDVKADWSNVVTARPVPRWWDDGRPHVVVLTLPVYNGTDGKVSLTVDGYRSESAANWSKTSTLGYARSYMLLGASNMFTEKRYTACSVAEIRFWRGTQLTEAQVKAFSEEMAATYGVELDGYTTFGVSGQHSREIAVASGATYGTDSNGFTLPLYAGQTLSGAGSVVGGMSAQAGSTIALASSGSPTFANLALEDGATIKIVDDGAAAMSVTGTLSVGANDVVTVDISNVADSKSSVNLATFASGTVTAENFQVSPANPLYSFKIADGKVKLSCANGMQIIFR
ncbi:MAG: autotransporter-associated beta strand repeat-containing protein [Kiritimatiellae bacterium]|nr:autotransporter-associated beta strand repeat-containing protein [Kiritimatiellia bacterium]